MTCIVTSVHRPILAKIDDLKSELLLAAGVQRDLDVARLLLGATADELALVRAALDQAQGEARKAAQAAEALRQADHRKVRGARRGSRLCG